MASPILFRLMPLASLTIFCLSLPSIPSPALLCPFRLAKFCQVSRGPDRHLGRSRLICVPGHWGAQTQDHLDEEGQESQLPAL